MSASDDTGELMFPIVTKPETQSEYERRLDEAHPDYEVVAPIAATLIEHGDGWDRFSLQVSRMLRRAVDDVIDTAHTNRFTLAEIEKTEKTYLGTKIEILFRAMFSLDKGAILDLAINGVEVDIKNTMLENWAIPREVVGRPCILIRENERDALCSVGVIVARDAYLRPAPNRDAKRSFSALGRLNTWWLLDRYPYPPNVWERMPRDQRDAIMAEGGGAARLARFFEAMQDRPIARSLVEHVAQQKDPMKRIRRNGGARDILAPKGIAVLYGAFDGRIIRSFGLPRLDKGEFIVHTPRNEAERALLRKAKHID